MVSYSREGSPKPDRNPVVIISTVASTGEEKQFVADDDKNDKPIIQQFVEYICQFDPDIIVSFGANTRDWDYLIKRSRRLGRTFDVDRAERSRIPAFTVTFRSQAWLTWTLPISWMFFQK